MKWPTMDEFAQKVADKAMDEVEFNGKTIRQWVEIILATDNNVSTKDGTNLAEVGTDCISRQAAIDYFVINVGFHDEDGYPIEDTDELRKIWTQYFDGIPTIQPRREERKIGEWIYDCGDWDFETCKCSECGNHMTTTIGQRYNFCPNCGADMREVTT